MHAEDYRKTISQLASCIKSRESEDLNIARKCNPISNMYTMKEAVEWRRQCLKKKHERPQTGRQKRNRNARSGVFRVISHI